MKKKDFEYLNDDSLRELPPATIIKNVYDRLKELGEMRSKENIVKVLNTFGYEAAVDDVPRVLERLLRKDTPDESEDDTVDFSDFKRRLKTRASGAINGLDKAMKLMNSTVAEDLADMIKEISATNMFSQHDGDYVRYDVQDPGSDTSNFQIQIGGRKLKTKGKSSVTAVVVDDEIVTLCTKSKQVRSHMAKVMKDEHQTSYDSGKVRAITLKD